MFNEKERPLCQFDAFSITTFRYKSGVAALRIINARGEIIVLPFQGQQVWRANFDGRELTMRSMFDEPVSTREYLENYGAFMIHCGITGLGALALKTTIACTANYQMHHSILPGWNLIQINGAQKLGEPIGTQSHFLQIILRQSRLTEGRICLARYFSER